MKKSIVSLLALFAALGVANARQGAIQCANLIYGGNHTSRCFSDQFLSEVQKKTTIPTERRFKKVKLSSKELFSYPFVMMTGESNFFLSKKERENLRDYLSNGGFLLASAGCSNKEWDRSFRREMKAIFEEDALEDIPMEHSLFSMVSDIEKLELAKPTSEARLQGVRKYDKFVVVYSSHGLNNTANTEGCCCCGANEIENSLDVNVNILVYALLH